jgi:hypothetical protein
MYFRTVQNGRKLTIPTLTPDPVLHRPGHHHLRVVLRGLSRLRGSLPRPRKNRFRRYICIHVHTYVHIYGSKKVAKSSFYVYIHTLWLYFSPSNADNTYILHFKLHTSKSIPIWKPSAPAGFKPTIFKQTRWPLCHAATATSGSVDRTCLIRGDLWMYLPT